MDALAARAEPIVAIATPPGRGAVGVVRLSGPDLRPLVRALCGRALEPRRASLAVVRGADAAPIDHVLALYFAAPHSYTGEDVLELQAHGGAVVLQMLLARCLELGRGRGLRLARPGEFTERAFLAGKLDLAQAEAVADLVDASTEAAARSAVRSLEGALSHEVTALADGLLELRALVEATLDFPEEDLEFLQAARARERLGALAAALARLLAGARQGALLREGIAVVLAGQPNVGKSSLLNALAGAELAIVTAVPGTTRDKVAQTIQIEGVPVHVVDTAGLRDDDGVEEVERIGIERSWHAIEAADAVLFVHDLTRRGEPGYEAGDATIAARLARHGLAGRLLHVYNKADVVAAAGDELALSARTGAGLARLRTTLLERVGWQATAEGAFLARARHVDALERASEALARALARARSAAPALELLAEELRQAHAALAAIVAVPDADALLGEIFGRFCIGK